MKLKPVELGIVIALSLAAAALLFAFGPGYQMMQEETVSEWQQMYVCGGDLTFGASFSEDFTTVMIESMSTTLTRVESVSGAQYEDADFVFQFKGENVTVSNKETGVIIAECSAVSDSETAPINFGD